MKTPLIIILVTAFINLKVQAQVNEISLADTQYYDFEIVKTLEKEKDTLYSIKYNYVVQGKWLLYSDSNKTELILESTYRNDTCVLNYYNEQKQLVFKKIISEPGDILRMTAWYSNGQLRFDLDYQLDTIPVLHYYEDGTKLMEAKLVGAYFMGEYKEWFENGNLKMIGNYHYDKIGNWKYYSQDGKLKKEEIYKDGEIIESIDY